MIAKHIIKLSLFLSIAVAGIICFSDMASAAEKFILVYKNNNQWVAKEDAEPLRKMIQVAKSGKHTHFKAILPPSKRDLSIKRLVVIRDILERQLKHSFIIEEIKGVANANTLVITPTHAK
jgi:hypothetical protein